MKIPEELLTQIHEAGYGMRIRLMERAAEFGAAQMRERCALAAFGVSAPPSCSSIEAILWATAVQQVTETIRALPLTGESK